MGISIFVFFDRNHSANQTATRFASPRTSHSQTTAVRQPASCSLVRLCASRATLPSNLADQKAALVAGVVVKRHSTWRCQKHPCTRTAARYFGNTRSGLPGKSATCSRNLNPSACICFLSASSGAVFAPRMPAIMRDLVSLLTTSAIDLYLASSLESSKNESGEDDV
jgi:hypothetical protein